MAKMPVTAFRQLLATIKTTDEAVAIPVGRQKFAYVDPEDVDLVSAYRWRKRGDYAAAMIDRTLVRMHRLLVPEVAEGYLLDHIDGDGLNNRRSNLRVCTPQQNACNRGKRATTMHSRFKGVTRSANGWSAIIQHKGRAAHLGTFESEPLAARAYDRAAKKYHGEFANTGTEGKRRNMTTAKVAKTSNRGSKPGERRGGRTKGTPNKATVPLKEAARQYTEAALQTLVSVCAGGEGIPAAAQVNAAKEILDRGYGKASTVLTGDEDGGPVQLVTEIRLVGPNAS